MAVILESGTSIKRWRGFSDDIKPQFANDDKAPIPVMSVFTEINTGRRYIRDEDHWVLQNQTIEALLIEANDLTRDLMVLQRQTVIGLSILVDKDLLKC